MKKCLKKVNSEIYHILEGKKINGVHDGIQGDVDAAELTDDERRAKINISQLLEDGN